MKCICENGQIEADVGLDDSHWITCPKCKGEGEVPFRLSEFLTEKNWRKGEFGSLKNGCSIIGGIYDYELCKLTLFSERHNYHMKMREVALEILEEPKVFNLIYWNDAHERTFAEVHELMLETEQRLYGDQNARRTFQTS